MHSKFKRLTVLTILKIIYKYTKTRKCENKHHYHFSLKNWARIVTAITAWEKQNGMAYKCPIDWELKLSS